MKSEFVARKLKEGSLEQLLTTNEVAIRVDVSSPHIKKVVVEGSRDRYEIPYEKMWDEFAMVQKRTNGCPASIELYFEGASPLVENLSLKTEPVSGKVQCVNGFALTEGSIEDVQTMLNDLSKSKYFQTTLGNFFLSSGHLYGDKAIVELLSTPSRIVHKEKTIVQKSPYVTRIGSLGSRFIITDTTTLNERFEDEKLYKHTEVSSELDLGLQTLTHAMKSKGFISKRIPGLAGRSFGFLGKEYKDFFTQASSLEQSKVTSERHELIVVVPGKRAFEIGSRIFKGIQQTVEDINLGIAEVDHIDCLYLAKNANGIGWIFEAPHATRQYLESVSHKSYLDLKGTLLL